MSGTLPPAIDADIKRFVDAVDASVPYAGTVHYSEFRKLFKKQNYFELNSKLLIVKISRSEKPFWGLTKSIIDSIHNLENYSVVLLASPTNGWLFSKAEVIGNIKSDNWPLADDGNYKINSPLPEPNEFKSIQEFKSKVSIAET
jgi:hypothetical protein